MSGEDKFEGESRDGDQMHYNSATLPSDWPFSGPNELTDTSMAMGMISSTNPMDNTCSSSAPMIDSFCPTVWDHHPTNPQNLGPFCDMNLQNDATTSSSSLGFRKGNLFGPSRNLEMSWAPPNPTMKRGGVFFPSQFPADSGFIERAARFSCFGAANFDDMIRPFGNVVESTVSPYPQEGFLGNGLKSASGEGCKDVPMSVDCDGSQTKNKNERQGEVCVRSVHGASRQEGAGLSGNNVPDEDVEQEEASNGSKKRRTSGQDSDYDKVKGTPQTRNEAIKNNMEVQQKGDNHPNTVTSKSNAKHGKQVSQASDMQKEEYIHVRARRGQATNSHSLAERVRREKISERMKFLQDLVPGCSKVTGKAVMLDEIINYVQSLQRQVEFLSMKLATVNPRMDFNIEGLLAKDILESRGGPSFGPDMTLHPSQTGILQGVGSSSDAVRRTINSHLMGVGGGYKDLSSQVPNAWDEELHNIIQMGLNPSTQDLGSTHLKSKP